MLKFIFSTRHTHPKWAVLAPKPRKSATQATDFFRRVETSGFFSKKI